MANFTNDKSRGLKIQMCQDNLLHLDDLPRQDVTDWHITDKRNPESIDSLSARRAAVLEAKQQEHIRLFQEYLKCCKRANCNSSMEGLALELDGGWEESKRPTSSKELSSFLPPNRHAGCRSRKASTVTVSSIPEHADFLVSGGRDAPASAGPAAPPTARELPCKGSASCSAPSPSRPAAKSAEPRAEVTARRSMEASVYRAQVATALGSGRPVWL